MGREACRAVRLVRCSLFQTSGGEDTSGKTTVDFSQTDADAHRGTDCGSAVRPLRLVGTKKRAVATTQRRSGVRSAHVPFNSALKPSTR